MFSSSHNVAAEPADVLFALTDPDAIARWSPVAFDIDQDICPRLRAGCTARVVGRLAGLGVGFDVHVIDADDERLRLRASGPVELDAEYFVEPSREGAEVSVSVDVQGGRGIAGGVVSRAVRALLAGGVLDHALRAIGTEAELLGAGALAA